jgi:SAM-dependent methyltransferase
MTDLAGSDYDDPALYDLENLWGPDDDFYRSLALRHGGPVLDLACGTGRLAMALAAAGLSVTGLDQSSLMLARARLQDEAGTVSWIEGDFRHARLGRSFRLILMTGHAFQHCLTDDDQAAALATVAAHLAPDGIFAFDVLNPAPQEFSAAATYELTPFADTEGRLIEGEMTALPEPGSGIVLHRLRRLVPSRGIVQTAVRLRYSDVDELDRVISDAGLETVERYGDWPDRPFRPSSPEIITLCRRAPTG